MTPQKGMRPVQILVVDDDPSAARLMQIAFQQTMVAVQVTVLHDNRETVPFLRQSGTHASAARPDLIVLDYKMPLNGGRTLAEIKNDPACRHIPVIIVTLTKSPEDIHEAYSRGANCVIRKPLDIQELDEFIADLERFWLRRVILPSLSAAAE